LNIMKKLILCLSILLLNNLAFAASDIDKEVALYIKDKMLPIKVEKMDQILERFHQESPTKNIVFFLHGRARHVEEEWKTLPTLENNYNARVVMFRWPAWSSLITRPVDRALESADEFAEALQGIKRYKEANPEIFHNKKITLLVHSMGHIVMREFIENFHESDLNGENGEKLLDNYVSAGADIGMNDHAAWMSRIDFVKKKFITMNNKDFMLILSYILDLKDRNPYLFKLGLGFNTTIMKKEKIKKILDPDATYIDLSQSLGGDHRYFESKKSFMINLFRPLLNGGDFIPQNIKAKVKLDKGIYYVNGK
jgi:hypothetical protein